MTLKKVTQCVRASHLGRAAKMGTLIGLAFIGMVGATAGDAHAVWKNKASGKRVVVLGDGVTHGGVDAWAWALRNQIGPGGGLVVEKGDHEFDANGDNDWFDWVKDGTAEGTSLAWQPSSFIPNGPGSGRPWLVAADSSVWYRTTAGWFMYPTNRCEGSGAPITVRQVVGDNAIAVGYNTNVYVVESNGTPSNSIRWWNGSCWWRLPTPPEVPTDVAVWEIGTDSQQTLPWIAGSAGGLHRWTGSAWVTLNFGTGLGVGGGRTIIGSDGTSIWSLNTAGNSFTWNVSPPGAGSLPGGRGIRNIGNGSFQWVTDTSGQSWLWR